MAQLYRQGEPPRPGERVLFWVPGGMPGMLQVEGAIAAALKLRGVEVHAVLCDGPFLGCVLREIGDAVPVTRWHERCGACKADASRVLDLIGIPYSFIGDYVPSETRSALRARASEVTWDNLDTIEPASNVRSSVFRFLKGASISGHEEIVPEYAYSALVCASAAEAAIRQLQPTRVFMSHGVYVDWGPALSVSLRNGVPVSAWMASYLDSHFYFRHIEDPSRSDLHLLSDEAWAEQRSLQFSPAQEATLHGYSATRYHKKVSFDMKEIPDYSGDTDALRQRYVGMPDKPTWAILAHVNWDAVFDGAPMAYEAFDEWIIDTIERICSIDGVNWLVKVHPAEAWDAPETGVQKLLQTRFPNLPPHVRVIPAEEPVSPLDFYHLVDGAVTIYGTAGLEIALLGKPVIVAGEAHYGRKGFTYDALTKDSYRELLSHAGELGPISKERQLLAMKYAYTYFIRRQVPLPAVHDPVGWWKFQVSEREALLPGNDGFVDFVCERILDGRDFLMSDELVASALAMSSVQDTPVDVLIAVT